MITRSMNPWAALASIAIMVGGSSTAVAQSGAAQEQQSLYDRLGGLAPISVVVSDFIDALVPDSLLNQNAAVDATRTRVPAPYLKYHVTALVCQATGGPCQYQWSRDERDARAPEHNGAGMDPDGGHLQGGAGQA